MKKYSTGFILLLVSFIVTFSACKKINEPTTLGGDLIPAVDNIKTFEKYLAANTNNTTNIDSVKVIYNDYVAAGDLQDPEFGNVHANFQFNILPPAAGVYPFTSSDSLKVIDSVVLSLQAVSSYGDTANGSQTFHVFEISPSSNFKYDTVYRYSDPGSDFATVGAELGSKTFQVKTLKDSFLVRYPDSAKTANVVRIKLNNALGTRLAGYDNTSSPLTGAYNSDSLFRTLFKGLAIKVDNGGNVMTYYSLASSSQTKLSVYYRIKHAFNNTVDSTQVVNFTHSANGQTNYVNITKGGNWLAFLNNGQPNDDKLYIQGAPSGSYASISIPDLSTFGNKVIHRAEIIATEIPSVQNNVFIAPSQLYLDRKKGGAQDTGYVFEKDLQIGSDGSVSLGTLGGSNRYGVFRFNITRYVQNVVTSHIKNDTLRISAPFETLGFDILYPFTSTAGVYNAGTFFSVPVSPVIYSGRVVLAGGNYVDPNLRLRLRIVYSDL